MSKLIALVATAVIIDGVRTVIEPGEELPALSAHDSRELEASGAAQDPARALAKEKADNRAEQKSAQEFESARKLVEQEKASIPTDLKEATATIKSQTAPAAKPGNRK